MDKVKDIIYILDKFDNKIGLLSNNLPRACPYSEDLHHDILENAYETFTLKTPIRHISGMPDLLEEENKVAFYDQDGIFKLFRIKQVKDLTVQRDKIIFAEFDSIELLNKVIRPSTFSGSPKQVLTSILEPSRWKVGEIETATTNSLVIEEHQSVLFCIHELAKLFGLEIKFRIEFSGKDVTGRYVDLVQQVGENNGTRIEYGQDIKGFIRTKDTMELATSLIGIGKANDAGVPISFKNVSWLKSLGNPVNKPLGQDWVGDQDALSNFSVDGRHIEKIFIDTDEADPASLLSKTWDELQRRVKAALSYEVDILILENLPEYEHKKVRKGDTIFIKDTSFTTPLVLEARILEMDRSKSNPSNDKVVLGEYREIEIKESDIVRKLQLELSKKSAKWDNNFNVIESDTEPETPVAGMYWLDTSKALNIWKRRNADNTDWIAATPSNPGDIGAFPATDGAEITEKITEIDERTIDIVGTVVYSQPFESIMTTKANTEDLSDMATGEQISAIKSETIQYVDGRIDGEGGVNEAINAVSSELSKTANEVNAKFGSSGGINLVNNSIGYGGKDLWVINGTVNTVTSEELEQLGFGSGFETRIGESGYIEQTINTATNENYTISFWLKKTVDNATDGFIGVELYENGELTTFVGNLAGGGVTTGTANGVNGYELGAYSFKTEYSQVKIRLTFGSGAEGIITGLMMNVGTIPLQWQHANGEVYNTNIQMNLNGLKVISSVYKGYTVMSPQEFSGYAEVLDENNQPQMIKVFTLNRDTTEVTKIDVDLEIIMRPIKVVPVMTAANYGWAFIASE